MLIVLRSFPVITNAVLMVNDRWPPVILSADIHSSYLHKQKRRIKNAFYIVIILNNWDIQKVPSKLNISKNFFPEFISQNTNTLKKLLSHNINLFRARISNSIHTLKELLPNNSEHFFESFNEHLNRQNKLRLKIPS